MNVLQAIEARHSVRAFAKQPVDPALIWKILEAGRKAPSWSNSQPWEFAVIAGEPLNALRKEMYETGRRGVPRNPDIPHPKTFPDRHQNRRRLNAKMLFSALNIPREDSAQREEFNLSMLRFFDAPVGIILLMDSQLDGTWSVLDMGCCLQNIMLAAVELGLGTCAEASITAYPDVVRKHLHMGKEKRVMCGLALGHPERGTVLGDFRSIRVALDEISYWIGIDPPLRGGEHEPGSGTGI
ncbi:MAG: nitroreductase [Deltaproteobacteria bacterium]|nr:nitroreductase [Deltaproteobacteria bacterium]